MTLPSQEKGNALEKAVRLIEGAIIHSFPGYSESTFRIEGKKIVVVDGVRHEVDVYVLASLGRGYESPFIFECKNWEEKVGKNEIIILSEKVKVLGAQRGFFVAKSYTADAIAQAALDPRIELLTAAELDPATVAVPAGVHLVQTGETHGKAVIRNKGSGKRETVPMDLEAASFELQGETTDLSKYVRSWIEKAREERCRSFPSLTLDGEHTLEFKETRTFQQGEAVVNGKPVAAIDLEGTVKVQVFRAVVVSAFEVTTRGRLISVEIAGSQVELLAEFVQVDPGPTA